MKLRVQTDTTGTDRPETTYVSLCQSLLGMPKGLVWMVGIINKAADRIIGSQWDTIDQLELELNFLTFFHY